jgi:hypothetical protein
VRGLTERTGRTDRTDRTDDGSTSGGEMPKRRRSGDSDVAAIADVELSGDTDLKGDPVPADAGSRKTKRSPADSAIGAATDPGTDPATAIARLTADDLDPGERRSLLGGLAAGAGRALRTAVRPAAVAGWIADTLTDTVPRLPLRDLDTLRQHHDGRDGEDLADRLVRSARRTTATIGATGGGLAAMEWIATPTLLSAPLLLSAETLAIIAVEVKLIAELHAVYRVPIAGNRPEQAAALLVAWSKQRGVGFGRPVAGMAAVLGTAARREVTERIARRLGRNLTTLAPLLVGAGVGAELNRRATKSLSEEVRRDLRTRAGRPD